MPSSTTTARYSDSDRSLWSRLSVGNRAATEGSGRRDPGPALRETQQWIQAAIMTPETAGRVGEMVLPSRRMSPDERLAVYQGMYEVRLGEALETDYPLLTAFLGEELWGELVGLYLEAHPSRSYTLNRLGDHLPEFLAELEGLPREAFLQDLARYELTRTLVFDAAQTPPITPDDVWAVPSDSWETVRLVPVAAFRLDSYRYPVQNFTAGQRPPRRKKTNLAVFRRDYRVLSLELSESAHRLLKALSDGQTLGEAIRDARAPQDRLFGWFRQWAGEGLFREVVLTGQRP